MANQGKVTPVNVDIQGDLISIQWSDGHASAYPHRYLRLQCHCATCVGEWPHQGELDPGTVPQNVRALECQTVGRYALQFLWSDGHFTGIYPYDGLRAACPCSDCSAARES